MEDQLGQLPELPGRAGDILTSPLAQYVLVGLVVLVVAYFLWRFLARRRRPALAKIPDLHVDVSQLDARGPSKEPPILQYYHVPMRLAVVVLAPAGRDRALPAPEDLPEMVEAIVPGLSKVIATHKPLVHRWPAQLSTHGFAHAFFANVRLPGDGGKGTPWCSTAGVFRYRGQVTLAGLVMCAGKAIHFGRRKVEQEEKWLDVLRVKQGEQ
jgi:hypothetical protein